MALSESHIWVVRPATGPVMRVVVPRRDVADSFVLQKAGTPGQAAQAALSVRAKFSKASPEDSAALDHFARDMRSEPPAF